MDKLSKDKVYYVASPYSHADKEIMKERYLQVDKVGYELMIKGFHIIEPIAATHHKALRFEMPTDYAWWQERCRKMLFVCDGIIVVMIDGWNESVGVNDELAYARELGREIHYLKPEEEA